MKNKDFVVIGNIAYDYNYFTNRDEKQGEYYYINGKVSGVNFDWGVVDTLRGLAIDGVSNIASKIVETIKTNSELYFDSIKPLTDMHEQRKEIMSKPLKETQETFSKLYNALNVPKIPNATDLLSIDKKN